MESNEVKRTDLIKHLIKTYDLKSYCEIGTQNRSQNFDKIICETKYCVDIDPNAKADFTGSSDEFFKQNKEHYDIYFLDGLHTSEQVKKDFENALRVLSPNGFIILHDCNPLKEEHTIVPRPTKTGHWNGDVYKFALNLSINEFYRTVDIDNGCGVYRHVVPCLITDYEVDWVNFNDSRDVWLNLITYDEFKRDYSHV